MKKNLLVYVATLSLFSLLIFFTLRQGDALKGIAEPAAGVEQVSMPSGSVWQQLFDNTKHPMALLILQVTVILVV